MVARCHETETHPISLDEIWDTIRTGKHGLKGKIQQIRNRYEAEKDITGDSEKAKKAVTELKLQLPGFLPSGTFSKRENGSLVEHSGILCADLDSLGEKLTPVRELLKNLTFVRAIALSPSGDGLKAFFNVVSDPARHEDSFRAIRDELRAGLEVEIDDKCKDPARICFFTYDPDLWLRQQGNEIIPPADPLPKRVVNLTPPPDLTRREQIAFSLVGELNYSPDKGGYFVRCPGESLHSNKTADNHTILYLESVPTLSCQHQSCSGSVDAFNRVLRSEIGRAEISRESRVSHPYRDTRYATTTVSSGNGSQIPDKPLFEICEPKWLFNYVPKDDIQLIGDYHIVKDTGFTVVVGGPPGVGKSLCALSLCIAGATGEGEWFGMTVHRRFKVLVIQAEDGVFRLSRLFKELNCDALQDYVRISKPPPYGLVFRRADFCIAVEKAISEFGPDIVILDPWNAAARDQEQRTYLETFELVRSVLPPDTALLVIAHTRKPQKDERASGRALMHLLAGSYSLVSVPRSVFVLQPASDDTEDNQVVWTCCKNNDGELGRRSAWRRKNGLFEPVPGFDWATFDSTDSDKRVIITEAMIKETFKDGPILRIMARDKLRDLSGASKSACYRALSEEGRFASNLIFNDDTINYIPGVT